MEKISFQLFQLNINHFTSKLILSKINSTKIESTVLLIRGVLHTNCLFDNHHVWESIISLSFITDPHYVSFSCKSQFPKLVFLDDFSLAPATGTWQLNYISSLSQIHYQHQIVLEECKMLLGKLAHVYILIGL